MFSVCKLFANYFLQYVQGVNKLRDDAEETLKGDIFLIIPYLKKINCHAL
jgi:hypothetical protein